MLLCAHEDKRKIIFVPEPIEEFPKFLIRILFLLGEFERIWHFAAKIKISPPVKKYLLIGIEVIEQIPAVAIFVKHVTLEIGLLYEIDSVAGVVKFRLDALLGKDPDKKQQYAQCDNHSNPVFP